MKKMPVFGFIAMLQKADAESDKEYFIAPFKVAAKTHDEAQEKLTNYLNNPEQTGFRYKKVLSLVDSSADIILVDDDFKN